MCVCENVPCCKFETKCLKIREEENIQPADNNNKRNMRKIFNSKQMCILKILRLVNNKQATSAPLKIQVDVRKNKNRNDRIEEENKVMTIVVWGLKLNYLKIKNRMKWSLIKN